MPYDPTTDPKFAGRFGAPIPEPDPSAPAEEYDPTTDPKFAGRFGKPIPTLESAKLKKNSGIDINYAEAALLDADEKKNGIMPSLGDVWTGLKQMGQTTWDAAKEPFKNPKDFLDPLRLASTVTEAGSRGTYDLIDMGRRIGSRLQDKWNLRDSSEESQITAFMNRVNANHVYEKQRKEGIDGTGNMLPKAVTDNFPPNQIAAEGIGQYFDASFGTSALMSALPKGILKGALKHVPGAALASSALNKVGHAVDAIPGVIGKTAGVVKDAAGLPEAALKALPEAIRVPAAVLGGVTGATHGLAPAYGALKITQASAAAIEHGAEMVQRLSAMSDGQMPKLLALAQDASAPKWMKKAAAFAHATGLGAAAEHASAAAKGVVPGAVVGGGLGALAAESKEERDQAIGGGIGYGAAGGLGGHHVSIVGQRRSADLLATYTHLKEMGSTDAALKKLGDNAAEVLANWAHHPLAKAATYRATVNRNVKILALEAADYAADHPNSPNTAASYTPDADGGTIRINVDAKHNEILHELTHDLMFARGADGDARLHIDQAIGPTGVASAAKEYAGKFVHQDLKAAGQTATGPALDALIAAKVDALNKEHGGDQWVYNEIYAEAGRGAFDNVDIFRDVLTPSFARRGVRSLNELGTRFRHELFGSSPDLPTGALFSERRIYGPEMRKMIERHAQDIHKQGADKVRAGKEVDGAPRGLKVAPSFAGKHASLPAGSDGVEDAYTVVGGQFVERPKREMKRREKVRQAATKAAFAGQRDKPKGDTSTEVAPRIQEDGTREISGTKFADQIDKMPQFSDSAKKLVRFVEGLIDAGGGEVFRAWYQAIGTSANGASWAGDVKNRKGNVAVAQLDLAPYDFFISSEGNALVRGISITAANRKTAEWKAAGKLNDLWAGNEKTFRADLHTYLENHAKGREGSAGIGQAKRDLLNVFVIGRNAQFEKLNPLREGLKGDDKKGIIRSLRIDRMANPEKVAGYAPAEYQKKVQNFAPNNGDTPASLEADRLHKLHYDARAAANASFGDDISKWPPAVRAQVEDLSTRLTAAVDGRISELRAPPNNGDALHYSLRHYEMRAGILDEAENNTHQAWSTAYTGAEKTHGWPRSAWPEEVQTRVGDLRDRADTAAANAVAGRNDLVAAQQREARPTPPVPGSTLDRQQRRAAESTTLRDAEEAEREWSRLSQEAVLQHGTRRENWPPELVARLDQMVAAADAAHAATRAEDAAVAAGRPVPPAGSFQFAQRPPADGPGPALVADAERAQQQLETGTRAAVARWGTERTTWPTDGLRTITELERVARATRDAAFIHQPDPARTPDQIAAGHPSLLADAQAQRQEAAVAQYVAARARATRHFGGDPSVWPEATREGIVTLWEAAQRPHLPPPGVDNFGAADAQTLRRGNEGTAADQAYAAWQHALERARVNFGDQGNWPQGTLDAQEALRVQWQDAARDENVARLRSVDFNPPPAEPGVGRPRPTAAGRDPVAAAQLAYNRARAQAVYDHGAASAQWPEHVRNRLTALAEAVHVAERSAGLPVGPESRAETAAAGKSIRPTADQLKEVYDFSLETAENNHGHDPTAWPRATRERVRALRDSWDAAERAEETERKAKGPQTPPGELALHATPETPAEKLVSDVRRAERELAAAERQVTNLLGDAPARLPSGAQRTGAGGDGQRVAALGEAKIRLADAQTALSKAKAAAEPKDLLKIALDEPRLLDVTPELPGDRHSRELMMAIDRHSELLRALPQIEGNYDHTRITRAQIDAIREAAVDRAIAKRNNNPESDYGETLNSAVRLTKNWNDEQARQRGRVETAQTQARATRRAERDLRNLMRRVQPEHTPSAEPRPATPDSQGELWDPSGPGDSHGAPRQLTEIRRANQRVERARLRQERAERAAGLGRKIEPEHTQQKLSPSLTEIPLAERETLTKFWIEMGKDSDIALYPMSKAKDATTLARELSTPEEPLTVAHEDQSRITFKGKHRGISIYSPFKKHAHISSTEHGLGGSQLYKVANLHAANNGYSMNGGTLLNENSWRRTSNQMSLAIQLGGDTSFATPGSSQGLNWKVGDHDHNMDQMARKEIMYTHRDVPELAGLKFDFRAGIFRDVATNAPYTLKEANALLKSWINPKHDAAEKAHGGEKGHFSTGLGTAKRAILSRSALEGLERSTVAELLSGPSGVGKRVGAIGKHLYSPGSDDIQTPRQKRDAARELRLRASIANDSTLNEAQRVQKYRQLRFKKLEAEALAATKAARAAAEGIVASVGGGKIEAGPATPGGGGLPPGRGTASPIHVYARSIADDLIATGKIDFIGANIRNTDEAAVLLQMARNPRFETFHYVFAKDGVVVGHYSATARMPNVTYMFAAGDKAADVAAYAKSLGADSFWATHNHPTGNPDPSDSDLSHTAAMVTKMEAAGLTGFQGHIVINHKTYSLIDRNGHWGEQQRELSTGDHDNPDPLRLSPEGQQLGHLLGSPGATPDEIARLGFRIASNMDPEVVSLMLLNARRNVAAIASVSIADFKNPDVFKKHLREIAGQQGASMVTAYYKGTKPAMIQARRYIKEGFLYDAVVPNEARSMREKGASYKGSRPGMKPYQYWQGTEHTIANSQRVLEGEETPPAQQTLFSPGTPETPAEARKREKWEKSLSPVERADRKYLLSQMRPTAKGANREFDPLVEPREVNRAAILSSPRVASSMGRLLRNYVNLRGAKSGTAVQVFDALHEHVKSNLIWAYNVMPEDMRVNAQRWYDGANEMARGFAKTYGQANHTVAGVLASLSPSKDWFMNVELGERMLKFWRDGQDLKVDDAMTTWGQKMQDKFAVDGEKKIAKAREAAKSGDEDAIAKLEDVEEQVRMGSKWKPILERIQGKAFSKLSVDDQAVFLRAWDESRNPMVYRVVNADGTFADFAKNKVNKATGVAARARLTWQSMANIEKALNILRDPTKETLHTQLGNQHKVRNFFNNLLSPSDRSAVTIDTHAVAIAFLRGLGGDTIEVKHNFGGNMKGRRGAPGNASNGAQGTYGFLADAYRDAAKELGILPRELQSAVWEAANRWLFPKGFKTSDASGLIEKAWRRYNRGEISLKKVRHETLKHAGKNDKDTLARARRFEGRPDRD